MTDDIPTLPAFPIQHLAVDDIHERPTLPTHLEALTPAHEFFAEGDALEVVFARQTLLLRFVALVTCVCAALTAVAYLS